METELEISKMINGLEGLSLATKKLEADDDERIRSYGRNFGMVIKSMAGFLQGVQEQQKVTDLLTLETEATAKRNENLNGFLVTALGYITSSDDLAKREDVRKFAGLVADYLKGPTK